MGGWDKVVRGQKPRGNKPARHQALAMRHIANALYWLGDDDHEALSHVAQAAAEVRAWCRRFPEKQLGVWPDSLVLERVEGTTVAQSRRFLICAAGELILASGEFPRLYLSAAEAHLRVVGSDLLKAV